MKLILERFEFWPTYTIGKLSVDGLFECYTLEDGIKVKEDKPCIPVGTYKVIVDMSNRFKKLMPHILDVPGYAGIRIHKGNTSQNTEGCILVGKNWTGGDWIDKSREAFDPLFEKLKKSTNTTIEIKNNP